MTIRIERPQCNTQKICTKRNHRLPTTPRKLHPNSPIVFRIWKSSSSYSFSSSEHSVSLLSSTEEALCSDLTSANSALHSRTNFELAIILEAVENARKPNFQTIIFCDSTATIRVYFLCSTTFHRFENDGWVFSLREIWSARGASVPHQELNSNESENCCSTFVNMRAAVSKLCGAFALKLCSFWWFVGWVFRILNCGGVCMVLWSLDVRFQVVLILFGEWEFLLILGKEKCLWL